MKQAEGSKLQWLIGFALASNLPMLKIGHSLGWKEVGRVPTALKPPISDDLLVCMYQVPPAEKVNSSRASTPAFAMSCSTARSSTLYARPRSSSKSTRP